MKDLARPEFLEKSLKTGVAVTASTVPFGSQGAREEKR